LLACPVLLLSILHPGTIHHLSSRTYNVPGFFFFLIRRAPGAPLFPYTTLFRSHPPGRRAHVLHREPQAMVTKDREQDGEPLPILDRKSTRLNSSHVSISYAVFCLKKKT